MSRPPLKREDLEHAVIEVVADKGLRGATIQDIAGAAGVSPGLLYRYWKNRDALAADVFRSHYTRLVDELEQRAAREVEVADKLAEMVHAFLEFADQKPVILKFVLMTQHELIVKLPDHVGVKVLLDRVLGEGLAQGKLRDLPRPLLMHLLIGIVMQPVIGTMYGDLEPPVSRHAPALVETVRRALFEGN